MVLNAEFGLSSSNLKNEDILIDQINSVLPQTQCGQCGFQGCKPYATALAEGVAGINQCPPGGDAGIRELSALLGREYKPLSPEYGIEKSPSIALIDEQQLTRTTGRPPRVRASS